jgi:hypothetical protein
MDGQTLGRDRITMPQASEEGRGHDHAAKAPPHHRSRASAVLVVAVLVIAASVLAIQARSVWSTAPTAAVRPSVISAEAPAEPKDQVVRRHREPAFGHPSLRQISTKKG